MAGQRGGSLLTLLVQPFRLSALRCSLEGGGKRSPSPRPDWERSSSCGSAELGSGPSSARLSRGQTLVSQRDPEGASRARATARGVPGGGGGLAERPGVRLERSESKPCDPCGAIGPDQTPSAGLDLRERGDSQNGFYGLGKLELGNVPERTRHSELFGSAPQEESGEFGRRDPSTAASG